ncbi:hypothetical protein O181_021401 [Austropuccinia psidii MF-1]|uniref:Putative lipoate-protein ligase A n=1 Tax=Austropuccinia psidii MF-1 TaxID=1389203 RepID=A0A9Q3CFF1_9BASI|nr:hypothetical protein [Austropuccinia psidii MF-1]
MKRFIPFITSLSISQRFHSKSPAANLAPVIWISNSLDPYLNLSIEEFLFRKVEIEKPILFLFRNRKSVIIGRNQNPWQEADLDKLDRQEILLVRRRSGGGTVYHDEGNTNYSVMVPRLQFNRRKNAELVASALTQMGVNAVNVTDRHDVCVEDFKVSGSAFRITNARAYHHGTMLINSDLAQLRGALRPSKKFDIVDSKAVGSVKSPVTSLSGTANASVNHEQFVKHVCKAFIQHYYPSINYFPRPNAIGESELVNNEFIQTGYQELKSWQWIFGQTPQFSSSIKLQIDQVSIPVTVNYKNGMIEQVEYNLENMCANIKEKAKVAITKAFQIGDRIQT